MKRRSKGLLRTRSDAVDELRRDLLSRSWPRAQMTLLVMLTGGTGLLASFLLLQAGVERMALRYPLALAVAYGVFLLLLWLWLRTKTEDWADVPDVDLDLLPSSGRGATTWSSGGGGQFGGGGASAGFDTPSPLPALRRTLLPFTLTALLLTAVGWGLQTAAPRATSLGDALHPASSTP